jgi:hypothetical protein
MVVRVLRPLDALEIDALLHHLPQRRHLSQSADVLLQQLDSEVDLVLRSEAACTQIPSHSCKEGALRIRRLH